MTDTPHTLTPRGQALVNQFADLVEYDGDVGDAFHSLGVSYDAFRKLLLRSGRVDLVSKLSEWKREDSTKLGFALGKQWH